MSDIAATPPAAAPRPTHADLFIAFLRITLSSIGGALPWTRRMIVERRRWMTAEEFNENYALCQFLPGPNIVNLAAVIGSRMRGATGAVAAWSGFIALPFCVMLLIARRHRGCGRGSDDLDICQDGDAAVSQLWAGAVRAAGHRSCDRRYALAVALGVGRVGAVEHRTCLVGAAMKAHGDILVILAVQFSIIALLSFPARESATLTTVPRAPALTV
jgi:chromate transport protein ChrA